jgi:hypothetical protein
LKTCHLLIVIMIPAFACCGATNSWTNGSGDNLWSNPANWSLGYVPYNGSVLKDNVYINQSGELMRCIADISAESSDIWATYLGVGNPDCILEVAGGSLQFGSVISIGHYSTAELRISGGSIDVSYGSTEDIRIGGNTSDGLLEITGGVLNVSGGISVPKSTGTGNGVLRLYGGVINANDFNMSQAGFVDITTGTMNLVSDKVDKIQQYVDNGWFLAYGGNGAVQINMIGGNTVITATPVGDSRATLPVPQNNEQDVSPGAALHWIGGYNADSHDVYLADDYDLVLNADNTIPLGSVYRANVAGVFEYTPVSALEFGKTYFWRIDAVEGETVHTGDVWSFTVTDGKAKDPVPEISDLDYGYMWLPGWGILSRDVANDQELQWTVDKYAQTQSLYVGTDRELVNEAESGTSEVAKYDFSSSQFQWSIPGGFTFDTTYYWRVDQLSDYGVAKGDVWAFTVRSSSAIDDFEGYGGSSDVKSVWQSIGCGVEARLSANIEVVPSAEVPAPIAHYNFDNDSDTTVTDISGNGNHAVFISPDWEAAGYSSRCANFNGSNYISVPDSAFSSFGESFTFSLWVWGDPALSPSVTARAPFGSYTDIGRIVPRLPYINGTISLTVWDSSTYNQAQWADPTVSDWTGSWNHYAFIKDADAGELYIYHNGQLKKSANASKSTSGINDFCIGSLYGGSQKYLGRIDEFQIFDTALSQSQVAALAGEVIEIKNTLHNYHGFSEQAMELKYDCSGCSVDSAVKRTFDTPMDWSRWGQQSLSIYFKGKPDNQPANLFIEITDCSNEFRDVYKMPDDLVQPEWDTDWREWIIMLADIASVVNITDIQSMAIGIECGGSDAAGQLIVDDISLWPYRCFAGSVEGDITGDCKVNYDDLVCFVNDWLTGNNSMLFSTEPSEQGLMAHYSFDQDNGTTVIDSSQNQNNAAVTLNGQSSVWNSEGRSFGCAYFDGKPGGAIVSLPESVFSTLNGSITISLWIKPDADMPAGMVLFDSISDDNTDSTLYPCQPDNLTFQAGDGIVTQLGWLEDYDGEWVHLAYVVDNAAGLQIIYKDGIVAAVSEYDGSLDQVSGFILGRRIGGESAFKGRIDDFSVYDRPLTQTEIMYLADVNEIVQPVLSPADVYKDEVIDFYDFSVIAVQWLNENL